MNLVRLWFLATIVFIAGAMIWSFAPVLIPVLALTLLLGLAVAGIVAAARWLERARGHRQSPDDVR